MADSFFVCKTPAAIYIGLLSCWFSVSWALKRTLIVLVWLSFTSDVLVLPRSVNWFCLLLCLLHEKLSLKRRGHMHLSAFCCPVWLFFCTVLCELTYAFLICLSGIWYYCLQDGEACCWYMLNFSGAIVKSIRNAYVLFVGFGLNLKWGLKRWKTGVRRNSEIKALNITNQCVNQHCFR